jgi:NifU-like protein involved in Fe-S cluster formation
MAVSPFDRPSREPGVSPGSRISLAQSGEIRPCAATGRRIPISHGWCGLVALRHGCSHRPTTPYIFVPNRAAINPAPDPQAMLNDVYNSRILELAGNIPRLGRLERPDATATAHSKLCGSTVTVDLKMDGDTVTDFAHEVKACALGQASSSIMARHVIGAKAEELRNLRETVRKMLKENGPPPDGRWADVAVLEPVRDYKARHASTLLTFDAVTAAIDQIEAKRRNAVAAE